MGLILDGGDNRRQLNTQMDMIVKIIKSSVKKIQLQREGPTSCEGRALLRRVTGEAALR